jgi:DNA-binding IclR family transcriptional regulator
VSLGEGFVVSRALQAMELLAFQPASAPQVAGALRVDPRTARRLLNRLVDDGWVVRSEGRKRVYTPTMRIVALAAQLADRDPLARAAQPVVTRLHEETGGVAHLAIPSYRNALCLVHRAGGPDVRPQLRELMPAHATAAGKVLLAYRDAWREDVLGHELVVSTRRTVTDPDRVRSEAGVTRARGYAIEDGEFEAGRRAIAVPVHSGGATPAALALSGRAEELDDTVLDGLGELLRARADEIHGDMEGRRRG